MKKIFLVLIIFLLSACSVQYDISFEKDVFEENFVIENEYVSGIINLSDIYKDKENFKIENDYYNVSLEKENNKELLKGSFIHKNINSIKNSYPINKCFRTKDVNIKDNILSINLKDAVDCPYISDIKINFKTDKYVTFSNADKIENNTYTWNKINKGIFMQIALDKSYDFKTSNNILSFLLRILFGLIIFTIFIIILYKLREKGKI